MESCTLAYFKCCRSDGAAVSGKPVQDADANSTINIDPEKEYKLKNPIVWMDLEMTGTHSALLATRTAYASSIHSNCFWTNIDQ